MKVGKNNEILEATTAELRAEWKKGEWNKEYTFDKYLDIQTSQNHIKILPSRKTKEEPVN